MTQPEPSEVAARCALELSRILDRARRDRLEAAVVRVAGQIGELLTDEERRQRITLNTRGVFEFAARHPLRFGQAVERANAQELAAWLLSVDPSDAR